MTRISVEELLDEAEFEHLKNKKTSTGGCSKEAPASLTFVTMTENCKYSRQWNLSIITAPKITLRDYMKFMILKCSRIRDYLPNISDMRLFYTDEENDEIFVGSDDEYKEMIKVAKAKNLAGVPMVIKCVRRISKKDGKKNDVLSRDCKNSPGKVTKSSPTKLRARVAKPISLTIKYRDDVQELSESLEKNNLQDEDEKLKKSRCVKSPSNHDIRKQQASVFDWMTSAEKEPEDCSPPAWFNNFMENFKEELVNEVSAKVVKSLGVVIENKLSGLELVKKQQQQEIKQIEKITVGKQMKKSTRDTEKMKKEAMRMTMEINEESESKELKKLRKALVKKTDKVVKIAMKIEKKQNQEDKKRKTSISSSSNNELGLRLPAKKEKKCRRRRRSSKKVKESSETETEEQVTVDVDYPVQTKPSYPLSPVTTYPLVPVVQNYPLVKAEDNNKLSILEKLLSKTVIKEIVTENIIAAKIREADKQTTVKDDLIEVTINEGKLVNAVFVSETPKYVKVSPGGAAEASIKITNMGCLKWTEDTSVQQIIASDKLLIQKKMIPLTGLNPGDERELSFNFKTPTEAGLYESVWNFFDGNERFGPPLIFKVIVANVDEDEKATEMKDYNNIGVEMKNLGISAKSQEMVEMSKVVVKEETGQFEDVQDDDEEEEEEDEDSDASEDDDDVEVEDDFDLLASEVDSLNVESQKQLKEDEFEVIPIPACFDLEVPFEMVENQTSDQELVDMKTKLQVVKNEDTKIDSDKPKVAKKVVPVTLTSSENLEKLVKLGFADRAKNLQLLELHQHDMEKVLEKLYDENNTDWAAIRH